MWCSETLRWEGGRSCDDMMMEDRESIKTFVLFSSPWSCFTCGKRTKEVWVGLTNRPKNSWSRSVMFPSSHFERMPVCFYTLHVCVRLSDAAGTFWRFNSDSSWSWRHAVSKRRWKEGLEISLLCSQGLWNLLCTQRKNKGRINKTSGSISVLLQSWCILPELRSLKQRVELMLLVSFN